MDSTLLVPDIRSSFTYQPSSYAIGTRPDREAVRNIRKKLTANLAVHQSDIDDSGGDMRFIVLRLAQWRDFNLSLQQIDLTDATAVAAAVIPAVPVVASPGSLTIVPGWELADYTLAHNRHLIKKRNFTLFTRYKTAVLQDIQAAVPPSIIAQICDEDGNIQHRSPSQVLDFLENKYRRMRPKDVAAILLQFDAPYDDSLTIDEYFHRQNRLIRAMQETDEPISPARAIRTCLGHMLTLVHLKRACIKWELELSPTWDKFCLHFSDAVQQHEDHQDALADAGLANSAITNDDLTRRLEEQAQQFYAQMAEQHAHSQTQFDALSAHLEHSSVPSEVPGGTTNTAASALEQQSIVAALEQRVRDLTTAATATQSTSKRSKKGRGKGRERRAPRTERRWSNTNYCWTHGCDIDDDHTSKSCIHQSPNHKTAATFTNRMGGSEANLHLRNN